MTEGLKVPARQVHTKMLIVLSSHSAAPHVCPPVAVVYASPAPLPSSLKRIS
jgi:hypothetical protein